MRKARLWDLRLEQESRSSSDEGDVKMSVDDKMEDVQGAAIPSFCRNRTAETLS